MSYLDSFYTPTRIAEHMVSLCTSRPRIIADLAAGDGELLRVAMAKWSRAKYLATDISPESLKKLSRAVHVTASGRCDFLSDRSRRMSGVLRKYGGSIDLILLNPPFSCRGGLRVRVETERFNTSCSIAMAFVLHAFELLSRTGEMVVIMPSGSCTSERDAQAWQQLRGMASVEIVRQHDRATFSNCFPTTQTVHIRQPTRETSIARELREKKRLVPKKDEIVALYRGTIQMHAIPPGNTPLAHSTDLAEFKLTLNGNRAKAGVSNIQGAFVAICRVGKPSREKVALYNTTTDIALSDCIVGLQCKNATAAKRLQSLILDNWREFSSLYGGTGAQYITTYKIAKFLYGLGYSVTAHPHAKAQLRRSVEGCF